MGFSDFQKIYLGKENFNLQSQQQTSFFFFFSFFPPKKFTLGK